MAIELAPGDHFGPFEILQALGEGGMARVFRVRAPGILDPCALKISHESVLDADTAARALREVAIVRTLANRHVPKIHDAGRGDEGHVYILMEELEGVQLDHWHDFDSAMPCGQAVWVAHQVCLALGEAHVHGIVHRDLKPENIWVEPDHNVRVLDFGLARAWGSGAPNVSSTVTVAGTVIGTPRYMQPEQLKTTKLSVASDVYSLATILYELLTGHTVFFADRPFSEVREAYRDAPMVWLDAHDAKPPVPIRHYPHCAGVPEALERLVMQCLSKDPFDRPADAVAMGNALGEILHHDLGIVAGAKLRIQGPRASNELRTLLPGIHRIGSGDRCEIRLSGAELPELCAVVTWNGPPDFPEVRVMGGDVAVTVGGRIVEQHADLEESDTIGIGGFELRLTYSRPD